MASQMRFLQMSPINNSLKRLLKTIRSLFLNGTLRILLVLLLLVTCYTCIALTLFAFLPYVVIIEVVVLNVVLMLHHWYGMTK